MALFGEALLSQYFSQVYTFSFWLYHIQEFAGFAVISYTVLGAYRRGLTDETLLESLLLPGTRAQLQAGYATAMEALVESLSRGQQPTPALRDALRARFGLAESQVRVLEEAATAVALERRQRQELEQLNQSLRLLEAHKDQLTQMIVHDLKNPLTALLGFLEILRLDHLTVDQGGLLQNAMRSGRNLSDLINDLLDIRRIEEGRLELEHIQLAPHDLLTECANEMHGWLAQEGKTITVEVPADLPPLYADYRLMRRVHPQPAFERDQTYTRRHAYLPARRAAPAATGAWHRPSRRGGKPDFDRGRRQRPGHPAGLPGADIRKIRALQH